MTGRVVEIFAARHRVEPLMTRGNGERGGLKTRGRKIKAFPSRPTRTGWRRSTAAFICLRASLSLSLSQDGVDGKREGGVEEEEVQPTFLHGCVAAVFAR